MLSSRGADTFDTQLVYMSSCRQRAAAGERDQTPHVSQFLSIMPGCGVRPDSAGLNHLPQSGPGCSYPQQGQVIPWSLVAPVCGVWSPDSRLSRGVWSHTLIVGSKHLQIARATTLQ